MHRTYVFYRFARTVSLALCLVAGWSSASWALEKVHVVQRGESLAAIARQYDVSISQLAAHNGIDNRDYIFVGRRVAEIVIDSARLPSGARQEAAKAGIDALIAGEFAGAP